MRVFLPFILISLLFIQATIQVQRINKDNREFEIQPNREIWRDLLISFLIEIYYILFVAIIYFKCALPILWWIIEKIMTSSHTDT